MKAVLLFFAYLTVAHAAWSQVHESVSLKKTCSGLDTEGIQVQVQIYHRLVKHEVLYKAVVLLSSVLTYESERVYFYDNYYSDSSERFGLFNSERGWRLYFINIDENESFAAPFYYSLPLTCFDH